MQFKDVLATLPGIDHVAALELVDAQGVVQGRIDNQPGSQGALRVYCHLAQARGRIGVAEAEAGLTLFAEHTADALARPGAHPNIDRLLAIKAGGPALKVRVISA